MTHIFISGHNSSFIHALRDHLVEGGYNVSTTQRHRTFQTSRLELPPDVVVVQIPAIEARTIHYVSKFRRAPRTMHTLIVVVSHQHPAGMIAQLLDAGADLFLAQPITASELEARIRALLRRKNPQTVWDAATTLIINAKDRSVLVDGRTVSLTPVEYDLLSYLCDTREDYQTAQELLHAVWQYPEGAGDPALVRNHIRNLRQKLEEDPERPRIIESMPKRGYRVNANVQWSMMHSPR
jgi:DNA-binding response OmpR family regulator